MLPNSSGCSSRTSRLGIPPDDGANYALAALQLATLIASVEFLVSEPALAMQEVVDFASVLLRCSELVDSDGVDVDEIRSELDGIFEYRSDATNLERHSDWVSAAAWVMSFLGALHRLGDLPTTERPPEP